ncbi:diguanylate cyclase [Algicella marina]|nr:diguanylate cyclase [Algicella marina]
MSGKVLIVSPVPALRALFRVRLEADYFRVEVSDGFEDIFQKVESANPDVIVLSPETGARTCRQLCRALKLTPGSAGIPVLMVLPANDPPVPEAFSAGADDIVLRSGSDAMLTARLRHLVRVRHMMDGLRLRGEAAQVLKGASVHARRSAYSDDQPVIRLLPGTQFDGAEWSRQLSVGGYRTVTSGLDDLAGIDWSGTRACIIGHDPESGCDGLLALSEMRHNSETRGIPVIMVLRGETPVLAASVLELGASDFCEARMQSGELVGRVRAQLRNHRQAEVLRRVLAEGVHLSLVDPLTNLHNRRFAETELERMCRAAEAERRPAATMMLDLDHFKHVNDSYGHAGGDEVLRCVARRLREQMVDGDLVARLGGEEFCFVRPGVDAVGARRLAEAIRSAVERTPVLLPCGRRVDVTVSIGVAMIPAGTRPRVEHLLSRADRALYASKAAGRNCISFHQAAA